MDEPRAGKTGYELCHLGDKFNPDMPDEEWIAALDDEGDWIVVTADNRITRQASVKPVWLEANLTTFTFSGRFATAQSYKRAEIFFKNWPGIVREAKGLEGDKALFKVFDSGKIEKVDFSGWS